MKITFEMLEEYKALAIEEDLAMVRLDEIKKRMLAIDDLMIEAAEWNGIYSFDVPENGKFKVKVKNHFRILKQDKPTLIELWKQDENLKVFVKEDVSHATIKKQYKDYFKEHGSVPEFIAMFPEIVMEYKPTRKRISKKKYSTEEGEAGSESEE